MATAWMEHNFPLPEGAKNHGDSYSLLKDDVRHFLANFNTHIKEQNINEIENDYQVKFPKLTEQYFSSTRWPSIDLVGQMIEKDNIFLLLYSELYYRHVYAHVSAGLSVEDMIKSYENYCALFNAVLKRDKPLQLILPNQWVWDIIDEFLYQFQKFSIFRGRQKHKPEDEKLLQQNPKTWSIHSVLNVLYSLVKKSSINELLSYYAKQGDPDDIADDFGRCVLYKMLGFFSLIGLCRLHCLIGDYHTAIKVLENIRINRLDMYHEVPTCHIMTGYYVGFAYFMMRRYQDAIRTLSATLAYKTRCLDVFAQRSDLREYVNKQSDQMSCVLGVCITLSPTSMDHTLEAFDRRDKYSETLNRLQQLDKSEFLTSFDMGCPKFISPELANSLRSPAAVLASAESGVALEPQRQQMDLFRQEVSNQVELLLLRSFLKLYTNVPVSKLANYMDTTELNVHMSLMAYKYKLKQLFALLDTDESTDPSIAGASFSNGADLASSANQQMYSDLDFYIDGNSVNVADTTIDRRFSEYFIRHVEMLQQMNASLDLFERRMHDSNDNNPDVTNRFNR